MPLFYFWNVHSILYIHYYTKAQNVTANVAKDGCINTLKSKRRELCSVQDKKILKPFYFKWSIVIALNSSNQTIEC